MAYLIDSCCFIEAWDRYFPRDICPGFWDWLEQQYGLGVVYSIDHIYTELQGRNDDLANWAKQQSSGFFLLSDNSITPSMTTISAWLVSGNAPFTRTAVNKFMSGADPFLVAHALANNHIVVTEETPNQPNQTGKVKIPTVCKQFKVRCITLHQVLRETGAQLVLS